MSIVMKLHLADNAAEIVFNDQIEVNAWLSCNYSYENGISWTKMTFSITNKAAGMIKCYDNITDVLEMFSWLCNVIDKFATCTNEYSEAVTDLYNYCMLVDKANSPR